MKRAIFLDRDGVINKAIIVNNKPFSPRLFEEFELMPDLNITLSKFKRLGFLNIVVTNQPDMARKLLQISELERMHNLIRSLPIDDIMVCPHDDVDNCHCRKPKPGMLLDASEKWGIDIGKSFLIGDTLKDMEAGRSAGCKTLLIDMPYNQGVESDYRIKNLSDAIEIVRNFDIGGGKSMSYVKDFLAEVHQVVDRLDVGSIEKMINRLVELRNGKGRLFFVGVGGGAGNATHAVNDFRKITGIESYAPTDNVSEMSARVNDDGWDTVFANWLKGSRLNSKDGIFVFSVGGGNEEKNISSNIVQALRYAKEVGAKVFGIVGRDGGYTAKVADACIIIPTINPETVTPHTESFQAVIWHLIVSHPDMKVSEMKWESIR